MKGIIRAGVFRRCVEPGPRGVPECMGRAVAHPDWADDRCTCLDFTKAERAEAEAECLSIEDERDLPPAWSRRRLLTHGTVTTDDICSVCGEEGSIYAGKTGVGVCRECAREALVSIGATDQAAAEDPRSGKAAVIVDRIHRTTGEPL